MPSTIWFLKKKYHHHKNKTEKTQMQAVGKYRRALMDFCFPRSNSSSLKGRKFNIKREREKAKITRPYSKVYTAGCIPIEKQEQCISYQKAP